MNYLKPERLEALAGEYVLGTLQGKARDRFERLMTESFNVRQAVWAWEQQINPLVTSLDPVQPSAKVWRQIKARTLDNAAAKTAQKLVFWRWWAGSSLALVLVLSVYLATHLGVMTSPSQWDQVAMFNSADNQPLWLVTTDSASGRFMVKPINAQAVAVDDQAYELWMLSKQGQPTSLGVMPVTRASYETVLSPQLLQRLGQSAGLAVSLEPPGGSPTGLPTGPVVYQAPIVAF